MGTGDAGRPPALLGDEADLFREFNARLVRSVQRRTNAPREMVDDAWQQFLQHQPDRDRNWRAWLLVTAERETWRDLSFKASSRTGIAFSSPIFPRLVAA